MKKDLSYYARIVESLPKFNDVQMQKGSLMQLMSDYNIISMPKRKKKFNKWTGKYEGTKTKREL